MKPRPALCHPAAVSGIAFLATVFTFAAVLLPTPPAAAQSFNCAASHFADEALICDEPGLARLDEQLATLYRHEFRRLDAAQQKAFHEHEDAFVVARRHCGVNYRCIEQSYRNRIKELEDMLADSGGESASPAQPSADEARQRQATGGGASASAANGSTTANAKEAPPAAEAAVTETRGGGKNAAVPPRSAPQVRPHDRIVAAPAAGSGAPPEVGTSERAEAAPRPAERHHTRRHKTVAVTEVHEKETSVDTTPAAPAPQAAARPAAPTIRWVDPPPGR